MRDGGVIYHSPVGYHRKGESAWWLWCDDCDWTRQAASSEEADREWFWHLQGDVLPPPTRPW